MKTITVVVLLAFISLAVSAQCKYLKNETDEFTGKISKQTELQRIAPGVQAIILQYADIIGIAFYADLDCVSPSDSKAYIKFSDGEIIILNHKGDINCGEITALAVPINDHLKSFTTKPISKIRLVGDRSMDFELIKPKFIGDTLNNCFDLSSF